MHVKQPSKHCQVVVCAELHWVQPGEVTSAYACLCGQLRHSSKYWHDLAPRHGGNDVVYRLHGVTRRCATPFSERRNPSLRRHHDTTSAAKIYNPDT